MTEHKKYKIITTLFKVLFVVGVIGTLTYVYFQVTGLKSRMTTAENRLNEGTLYYDDIAKVDSSLLPSYKIVNVKDVDLRVDSMTGGPEITYVKRPTKAYTISVDNTTGYSVEVDIYSIRARTENGQLVMPSTVDPSEKVYDAQPISLAPGGKAEVTLYYVAPEGQSFTSLYDFLNQIEIK